MVKPIFRRLNKDGTGVGEDLNISPDRVMGTLFEDDVRAPIQREELAPVKPLPIEEVIGPRKSRFNNASNLALNRLF